MEALNGSVRRSIPRAPERSGVMERLEEKLKVAASRYRHLARLHANIRRNEAAIVRATIKRDEALNQVESILNELN